MKKFLIFYGSYGGGHLSAAKAIKNYIETHYSDDVKIEMIDCIGYINKYLNKVSTDAYKELAKKMPWMWKQVYERSKNGPLSHISNATNKLMSLKLNQLIQEVKPDFIISTHPFSTQMCAYLKSKGKITCKLATIMTDYHIHPQWLVLYGYTDYFFVSNEEMKSDMIKIGINDERIFVTGIPVSEKFSQTFDREDICNYFSLDKNKKVVLFFAGGEFGLGRDITFMTLKALIRLYPNLQVIAISGKNKKMNAKFNELVTNTNSSDRIKVLEFTDMVPEIMSISIGVITKPGGLTTSECLVSNKPILIINPIPGQEEENAEFLISHNLGLWLKKGDNISRVLKTISRNPDIIDNIKESQKQYAKPDATKDISETIIQKSGLKKEM